MKWFYLFLKPTTYRVSNLVLPHLKIHSTSSSYFKFSCDILEYYHSEIGHFQYESLFFNLKKKKF